MSDEKQVSEESLKDKMILVLGDALSEPLPPASAEAEGLKAEISTRASFNLDAGSASSGKYLYIYLRWYNTKHPALAGPWSSMNTTLIL